MWRTTFDLARLKRRATSGSDFLRRWWEKEHNAVSPFEENNWADVLENFYVHLYEKLQRYKTELKTAQGTQRRELIDLIANLENVFSGVASESVVEDTLASEWDKMLDSGEAPDLVSDLPDYVRRKLGLIDA